MLSLSVDKDGLLAICKEIDRLYNTSFAPFVSRYVSITNSINIASRLTIIRLLLTSCANCATISVRPTVDVGGTVRKIVETLLYKRLRALSLNSVTFSRSQSNDIQISFSRLEVINFAIQNGVITVVASFSNQQ